MLNTFNLHSLTGARLAKEISNSQDYDLNQRDIREIVRILNTHDVHILSCPRNECFEAQRLGENLLELDPHRIHYRVWSDAEFKFLELFEGNPLIIEAYDIIELIEATEFSFVQHPKRPNQHVWSFVLGSAPFVKDLKTGEYLKPTDPKIQTASDAGLAKSMRYTY